MKVTEKKELTRSRDVIGEDFKNIFTNVFTTVEKLTIRGAISIACKHLKDAGIDSPDRESEWIVMHCTGKDLTQIWAEPEFVLSEGEALHVAECVFYRLKRLPLQYVLGECEFFGHKFIVNEDVLIPRIDSEVLVEEALKFASKLCGSCDLEVLNVLDLCCGSGALGCALNIELLPVLPVTPVATVIPAVPVAPADKLKCKTVCKTTFVDVSEDALNVARKNVRLHGLKADFVQANALNNSFINAIDDIVGNVDVMLFNPPYVKSGDISFLSDEVRAEPSLALDGGENGLEFYEYIIPKLPNILSKVGRCFAEIGFDQYADVSAIVRAVDGLRCDIKKDAEMRDRVVCVWRV